MPGASAVLAALVVAGLPTDRFFFEGFLPHKSGPRRARLAELARIPGTLVFFEVPRRVAETLARLPRRARRPRGRHRPRTDQDVRDRAARLDRRTDGRAGGRGAAQGRDRAADRAARSGRARRSRKPNSTRRSARRWRPIRSRTPPASSRPRPGSRAGKFTPARCKSCRAAKSEISSLAKTPRQPRLRLARGKSRGAVVAIEIIQDSGAPLPCARRRSRYYSPTRRRHCIRRGEGARING